MVIILSRNQVLAFATQNDKGKNKSPSFYLKTTSS
jgi:hypothetical protein